MLCLYTIIIVAPNNNPIKHAHHVCSPLHRFSSTCYLDSDGQPTCDSCAPGYSGRRCERCVTTTLSFRLFFFLVFCLSWSSGHCCVIVVTGRAGSKVSKGLAVASSGSEFRWKGYKHVCGWHLLFIISVAVVIECCQWRDGSCKSVPPILMCLDVRYSVLLFFFFQSCWWILFSWIYWIEQKKMKGSFSILHYCADCRRSDFFLLFLENKYAKGDLTLFLLETIGSVVFTTFACFWLLLHLYVSPDVAFCFSFVLCW